MTKYPSIYSNFRNHRDINLFYISNFFISFRRKIRQSHREASNELRRNEGNLINASNKCNIIGKSEHLPASFMVRSKSFTGVLPTPTGILKKLYIFTCHVIIRNFQKNEKIVKCVDYNASILKQTEIKKNDSCNIKYIKKLIELQNLREWIKNSVSWNCLNIKDLVIVSSSYPGVSWSELFAHISTTILSILVILA